MQFSAKEHTIIKTHLKVTRVVDGDGLIVTDMFGNQEEEIRLLGIDAPELKRSRKLKQDERETHLPGALLIQLGLQSMHYLSSIVPLGTSVTIAMERTHSYDSYGRTLAYVFLNDGSCLNEIMIREGYAKAYSRYYCEAISEYHILNFSARKNRIGLYNFVQVL